MKNLKSMTTEKICKEICKLLDTIALMSNDKSEDIDLNTAMHIKQIESRASDVFDKINVNKH